ncbi:hypothetical protein M0R45_015556 [Rubus argutus]
MASRRQEIFGLSLGSPDGWQRRAEGVDAVVDGLGVGNSREGCWDRAGARNSDLGTPSLGSDGVNDFFDVGAALLVAEWVVNEFVCELVCDWEFGDCDSEREMG